VSFPRLILGLSRNHFGATFLGPRDNEPETAQIVTGTASLGFLALKYFWVTRGICATKLASLDGVKYMI
jgi:hypothetical protein